jgi:hypothetical protein
MTHLMFITDRLGLGCGYLLLFCWGAVEDRACMPLAGAFAMLGVKTY